MLTFVNATGVGVILMAVALAWTTDSAWPLWATGVYFTVIGLLGGWRT